MATVEVFPGNSGVLSRYPERTAGAKSGTQPVHRARSTQRLGLRTLTRTERVWVAEIWDAIFPRGAHPTLQVGIRDMDVDGFVTELERTMPRHWMLGFRAAIVLIALGPLVFLGRLCTIRGLDRDARLRLLDRMSRCGVYVIRQLSVLLKMAGAMLYGRAPEVRRVVLRPAPAPRPAQALVPLHLSRPA